MQSSAEAFAASHDQAESGATPPQTPAPVGVTVPPPRSVPDIEADPDPTLSASGRPAAPDADSHQTAGADIADRLTERERGILAFEQHWWKHAGAKEQAIQDTFGLSATRYYQLLNGLLDNPAALAAEPLLIGRLRRLRSTRSRNRRR